LSHFTSIVSGVNQEKTIKPHNCISHVGNKYSERQEGLTQTKSKSVIL